MDLDQMPSALGNHGVVLIRDASADEVDVLLRRLTEPVDHPHSWSKD
ncbi:hypothetical protein ACIBP4_24140 [Micromonospora maritima]|uniref:Uncharacterized protein n=1 Tax=Micromonospora maritima TaxID=986711 RepID=A0ABW7ZT54_9ACTN